AAHVAFERIETLGPLQCLTFRGSIPHPMQSLCTLRNTTVTSGHATLATKRTLPLTWAGLAPAGSHQLCLAHLFDHLVGDQLHRVGNGNADSGCGSHIDDELEFRRLLHGQVAGLLTLENPPGIDART